MKTETFTRATPVVGSSTVDPEARTVQVVWTTGAAVKRYDWDEGYYMEELAVDKKSIRMDRFEAMSLLDGHEQTMGARLGTVVPGSVRIEAGKALATIRFSRNDKADVIFRDLLDGHPIQISVGYKIHAFQRTEGAGGKLPVLRAIDWEPTELSEVAVPADPGAISRKEETMPEEIEPQRQQYQRPANLIAERKRVKDIRDLARSMNMAEAEMDEAIDSGEPVESFRTRAFDKMIERQNQSPTFPMVATRGMEGSHETIRSAMADALRVRIDPAHKPQDSAREFVGLSLPELARRSLEANGVSTRSMAPGEVVSRALHTTSDFSEVISSVGQTVLGAAYSAVPSGIKALARKTTARDFKLKTTARLSGFADLEKVNEHGEYKRGTFAEGSEGYRISTFGKVFGMTRQMIVNDELGAFADVSRDLGLSAARLEADILANLVNSNPAMSDGKAVFHAVHKNLATAGADLNETSLDAARLTMGRQTGLAGELIDVLPAFLLVSLERQTAAEKLLAAIQPTKAEDVNVYAGRLQLVVDRRLAEKPWYMVANHGLVPSLEYAYLEGQEGPQFTPRPGFEIDGVELKVSVDFGAGWTDHRGWYKNAGQ